MSIRRVTLIVVLALGSLALPSASEAARIGLVGPEGGPQQLRYQAGDRERNHLRVDPLNPLVQELVVSEAAVSLTLGAGCAAGPDVRCFVPRMSGPGTGVAAALGDRADTARLVPFYVDSHVWGERGDDDLYSNGWDHGDAWGGPGSDTIALGAEFESRGYGGDGDDTLTATAVGIELYGGDGNDVMRGESFSHLFDGGRGADTIVTPPGPFHSGTVHGGDGGDLIVGGRSVFGEGGADRIDVSGNDALDSVSCGAAKDSVLADPDDTVAADCELVTHRVVATAASSALGRAERRAEAAYRRGAGRLRPHGGPR